MRLSPILCVLLTVSACRTAGPPYGAAEAIPQLEIEPGFRIELFVSEPAIASPVAMEFDEEGRIFVVEDRGYPLETDQPLGRIKLLEDTNGDGLPDKSTIFADGLKLPTGVMRWKKGILVTDAPYVWYLEDTDGDGRADRKEKLLEGFALTNPQHTVNSPVYGLDNWIYLAHENATTAVVYKDKFGDPGEDIRFSGRPPGPLITDRSKNVRFQPDSGRLEALAGSSQFGHTFDAWGHHFTLNNSNHTRHEVLSAAAVQRNPHLALSNAMQDVSDHGAAAKVFPITRNPEFQMLTNAGEFTSACGLTMYLGGAVPAWESSSFVAEPVHNLVHRDVWTQQGSTFRASRAAEGREFLASRDPWFRPVNFYIGPDGALYLIDYYRQVIEHPEWMSAEVSRGPNLYKGQDRGRIYRITQSDRPSALPRGIHLSRAADAELVAKLADPNIWWRRTAQRLLVDRRATGAVPALAEMARGHASPLGLLHALWTLEGLGKLDTAIIGQALHDASPGVRENAIRLAEPGLGSAVIALAADADAKVRFQALASLAALDLPAARAARDQVLFRDVEDRWVQAAALSASSGEAARLLPLALERARGNATGSAGWAALLRQIGSVTSAAGEAESIRRAIGAAASGASWWRVALLEGLASGYPRNSKTLRVGDGAERQLLTLFQSGDTALRRAGLLLLEKTHASGTNSKEAQRARSLAADAAVDQQLRADAITLISILEGSREPGFYQQFVAMHEPDAVQIAALRALRRSPGEPVGRFLIANWRTFPSGVRQDAADTLYADPQRSPMILDALKSGEIPAWTLSFRHRRQLMMHRDPAIRDAARAILEQSEGTRKEVFTRYKESLAKDGAAVAGHEVYQRVCAKCHRFRGEGTAVGPDLETVRNQPEVVLLEDILIPSKSIAQNYEAYVVETAAGETLDGVLAEQTATTIVLRHEEGRQDVIPRAQIKRMYATTLSAMPGDLDKQVNPRQMADLLRFMKSNR